MKTSPLLLYISLVSYCGILSSLSATSVDIILPSLGIIARDFNVSHHHITLSITLFVWALGIGQGFWGFASDRFGRKPIILAGLSTFTIGCIIAIFAPHIYALLFGRIIQGLGIAVSPVISRAILRDKFSGPQLSKSIAISTAIFSLGPIIAPLTGALIAQFHSWHAIFFFLAALSLLFIFATLFLKETIPFTHKNALSPSYFKTIAIRLFSSPQSRFYTLLCTCVWFFFLSTLANLPRFFEELFNVSGTSFAILFALFGFAVIAGQFVNHKLINLIGTEKAALVALFIMTSSNLITLIISHTFSPSYFLLIFFMTSLTFSYPILLVTATTLTLDPHGDIAGGISSLFGFFFQTTAALLASLLALLSLSIVPWLSIITITSALCFLSLLFRIQKLHKHS